MGYLIWCKDRNEFETDGVCMRTDGWLFHLGKGNIMPLRPESHIPMLFIGIKDMNDNELFEGAMVEVEFNDPNGVVYAMHLVKYDAEKARYVLCDKFGDTFGFDSTLKAIYRGHIYQEEFKEFMQYWNK